LPHRDTKPLKAYLPHIMPHIRLENNIIFKETWYNKIYKISINSVCKETAGNIVKGGWFGFVSLEIQGRQT